MKFILSSCFSFIFIIVFSQSGGNYGYQVLNIPFSTRSASLGNDFISVLDDDIQLIFSNPSILNNKMNKKFALTQGIYGATNVGSLVYAKSIDTLKTFALGIRNINYGNLDRYDSKGYEIGKFYSGDFVISGVFSKMLNPKMGLGTQLNLIYSQLESYSSFAGSIDFAGYYNLSNINTFITIVAKNIGIMFKPFVKDTKVKLPVEAQFAISHKLKHAPFRFNILAHHLNIWDLTYYDPYKSREIDPLTGDTIYNAKASFTEKLFRHLTYQAEFLLTKNINLRIAFDYHRRRELKLVEKPGIAGFSFGLGLNFKRIKIDYGFVCYSAAGYGNFLTLSTNFNNWKRN